MNSYFFKITDDEKKNILNKHKELYNGYVSLQRTVEPTQLSVFDDITDKRGYTLKNSDVIIEAKEKMCSECGGGMYEGECMECGSMNEGMDVEDLNTDNSMDYMESDDHMYEMDEEEDDDHMYEMDEEEDDEHIYEIEEDDDDLYNPVAESFVRSSNKLGLVHEREELEIKKENLILAKVVDNDLVNIRNFMRKINNY